eukprot:m51a1_g6404 hypothetical protein (382) ;mRNA; r:238532-239745
MQGHPGHTRPRSSIPTPVVFVHGFQGGRLRGPSGDERWLSSLHLLGLVPVRLALPLWSCPYDPDDSRAPQATDGVLPCGPLESVSPLRPVYSRALAWLADAARRSGRELIAFAYDWRRELDEAAAALLKALRALGSGRAHVVAHSMGGLVVLRAMREDPAAFASVLFAGAPFAPFTMPVVKMTPGTPQRGRSALLDVDTLFTFPSNYHFLPLPPGSSEGVVDEAAQSDGNGEEQEVRWYDPAEWARRKIGLFRTAQATPERVEHVRRCLNAARRFRERVDGPFTQDELRKLPPLAAVVGVGVDTPSLRCLEPDGTPVMETVDGDGHIPAKCAVPPSGVNCSVYKLTCAHAEVLDDGDYLEPILLSLIQRGEALPRAAASSS